MLPLLAAFVCVLLSSNFNAQTTDIKTPAATASISGTVNLNDKPAPDVLVVAQFLDRMVFQQPPARAKSDASGRYRISGLSAGQYQISVIAPAMALANSSVLTSFYGPSKPVVLSAAEEVDDVDIKLVKGSVITGRITDADDKPVVDQRVNLQMVDQSGNVTRQVDSFLSYQMNATDDRGIYRIFGLSAGRYRIGVGSTETGIVTNNAHAVYPLTYYGGTGDANRATIVELQEGSEATNIDIHLGRAGNSYMVSGRLIDADTGQPVPGIRIMYGPVRQGEQFYGGFIGMPTGPRGEFRLEGLEPGRYGVSISATFDASIYYSEPVLFNISDSDVTNLELKATRGQTLSGVVVFEGSRAKQLQQQLSSLRMIANVRSTSTTAPNGTSASGSIAGDGTFQIGGVRPGRLTLLVGAFGNPTLYGVTVLRAERGGVDVTKGFDLQPGESISDLRVTAALGSGSIRGTVRIIGGELPATARLSVTVRREGSTSFGGSGLVDARGRFVISNLVSVTYEVMLHDQSRPLPPQKQMVNVSDDGETLVDFVFDVSAKEGGP
jgi:protocatechuate 3,4-dioxygenase beta subunit